MGFEADTEVSPLTAEQEAQLHRMAVERAPEALAKLERSTTQVERFYALTDAAPAALYLRQDEKAAELATELIEVAPIFEGNWNYGNAIHAAHTVRGLLALSQGDTGLAVKELHRSGASPGSPQLASFGPTMQLAKALLRIGEFEAVLQYLQQCRAFWEMGEP